MDAFQGFCRAKTNLYIFQKLKVKVKGIKVAKSAKPRFDKMKIFYINPRTCGVYKNGGSRFKVDSDGQRTKVIDNELIDQVVQYRSGNISPGSVEKPASAFSWSAPFVPRYHDPRWNEPFDDLVKSNSLSTITLGELLDQGIVVRRFGHGSPGGDQRVGTIPYIKVSDIRNLRINVNPTNLVPFALAKKKWGTKNTGSGLKAWDLLTPIRASNNIGEFAVLLPGEEQVVLSASR
jgi:type I restriction enzyme M protein